MGRYAKLKEEVEKLKCCIAEGHKYLYMRHYRAPHIDGYVIEWKCGYCGFRAKSQATKEQAKIIERFKGLEPEKRKDGNT